MIVLLVLPWLLVALKGTIAYLLSVKFSTLSQISLKSSLLCLDNFRVTRICISFFFLLMVDFANVMLGVLHIVRVILAT